MNGTQTPLEYLASLQGHIYEGFNLVVGDLRSNSVAYYNNRRTSGPADLAPGTYGVSNGVLSEWPKVVTGVEYLKDLMSFQEIEQKDELPWESIFQELLSNKEKVEEGGLPNTGCDKQLESLLSPRFIDIIDLIPENPYGTRSQIVLVVWNDGEAEMREYYLQSGSWQGKTEVFHVSLDTESTAGEMDDGNNNNNSHDM